MKDYIPSNEDRIKELLDDVTYLEEVLVYSSSDRDCRFAIEKCSLLRKQSTFYTELLPVNFCQRLDDVESILASNLEK